MYVNRILYEDNDIIVCHKPAGIATQTARVGQADMASEITNYLKAARPDSKKTIYVRVIHRLDQPVEGILVFAKNKTAATVLSRQAAGEQMEKEYLAVVCGKDMPQSGKLTDYLVKDGRTNTSRVVPSEVKDAKKAVLEYEVLEKKLPEEGGSRCLALVRIRLHTGRHHQIRVQMANAGMPLLGDHKYADEAALALSKRLELKEVALCASRLVFDHPGTGKRLSFQITPKGAAFQKIFKQFLK